jgi:hypothetical protein
MVARATLEDDGVRYRYEFVNHSKLDYATMQAVTDPRMVSRYFHDVRLERSYVHHKDGFDLVASETPDRLTLPLNRWLPNRHRVSYTWPVEPQRVAISCPSCTRNGRFTGVTRTRLLPGSAAPERT